MTPVLLIRVSAWSVRMAWAMTDRERKSSRNTCIGEGMEQERRDASEEKNDDKTEITKPPTADQKEATPDAD